MCAFMYTWCACARVRVYFSPFIAHHMEGLAGLDVSLYVYFMFTLL